MILAVATTFAAVSLQRLRVLSATAAKLQLVGLIKLDEPVVYDFEEKEEPEFSLTEATHRIMRRFRTSLQEIGYDKKTDTPWVVVRPPLPVPVCIRLAREPSEHCEHVAQPGYWMAAWGP